MSSSEAGVSIDRIAKDYVSEKHIPLKEAYRLAMRENPNLAAEYNDSRNDAMVKNYDLSAIQQEMTLLQADRPKVQRLAGERLDTGATNLAGSNQMGSPNQVAPERYAAAMKTLMGQYPSLARAYNSGVIDGNDWELLCTLIPSTASAVWNEHKVSPINWRAGNYSERTSVHAYSSDSHVKYDAAGREFRTYSFAR